MRVAVVGGGAAGFFAAIAVKENFPDAEVVIFEKSNKVLAKVKVSGGGRCNVTNACTSVSDLVKAYPRGGNRLKKAFGVFNTVHTRQWFNDRGVALKAEQDGRVFPVTDNSQTIIDCLLNEVSKNEIILRNGQQVEIIKPSTDGFELSIGKEGSDTQHFHKIIVASGGSPKREGLAWLERLGHEIITPVPSLFTFNMPQESIKKLMGVAVQNVQVNVQGTKLKETGPLLITHWGFSGPAILKLSAYGARLLSTMNYKFIVQVNWVNESNNEVVLNGLLDVTRVNAKKIIRNYRPYGLPEKLWLFFLDKIDINAETRWGELGKKLLNKLVNLLTNDIYEVEGKTTFKEEFVTCGGVSLDSIDMKTMQSKVTPNLYFAGEVMDIDGITGGYNFQAAWTTGFIAGKLS